MAQTARKGSTGTRTRSVQARRTAGKYETDGNAAKKLAQTPSRRNVGGVPSQRRLPRQNPRAVSSQAPSNAQVSLQARKNREKALNTNRGFVIFLAFTMVAIMGCCVNYIRLKSRYTSAINTVAALESELAALKEDNDAYYSEVSSDIDLTSIKKIAIGRLGMGYPSDAQKETYTTSQGSGYVRQYQDLP